MEQATEERRGNETRPGLGDDRAPVAANGRAEEPRRAGRWGPSRRTLVIAGVVLVAAGVAAYFVRPWIVTALNTASTDDAYVNGHVTQVAPRVDGQVVRVLVEDN